jgi:hypothetical protein
MALMASPAQVICRLLLLLNALLLTVCKHPERNSKMSISLTKQPLTEEQIEWHVERAIDRLDKKLFKGSVSMEEYYRQFDEITEWAKQQEQAIN